MSKSTQAVVDITALKPAGKAVASEKNGIITVRANSAIKALQLIAAQGGISIQFMQSEIDDLTSAGKLEIKVSFSQQNTSSAAQAAQQVVGFANASLQAKREMRPSTFFEKIFFVLVVTVLLVVAFLLAIWLLDALYGTHQLWRLLGKLEVAR